MLGKTGVFGGVLFDVGVTGHFPGQTCDSVSVKIMIV